MDSDSYEHQVDSTAVKRIILVRLFIEIALYLVHESIKIQFQLCSYILMVLKLPLLKSTNI